MARHLRGARLVRDLLHGAFPSSSASAGASSQTQSGMILGPGISIQALRRGFSSRVDWKYAGQRSLLPFSDLVPDIAVDAWVAPNALLAGDVVVEDKATIWYGVVARGDLNRIRVGPWSSVGDKSVLHAAASSSLETSGATEIARSVTIGPYSTLRACIVENEVVIGQRCVIMEGSIIGKHAILASGSVVPPGRQIPSGEVWAGNPARFVRLVTNDEIALIPKLAETILALSQTHAAEFLPYSTAYLEVEKLFGSSRISL